MPAQFEFYGGPLDGANVTFPDADMWIADIVIALPAKSEADVTDGIESDLILHQYMNCHSWDSEDEKDPCHYMGHVGTIRKTIKEVSELFG